MVEERGGPVEPFADLEVIRLEAGMSTSRFCWLIDMPERTWRRWQAKARSERPPKGPWPQPAREAARLLVTKHALAKPAWGHRKISGDDPSRRPQGVAGDRAAVAAR